MASQEWGDPEMPRHCPFDKVHVVQAYRYQRHVLRSIYHPSSIKSLIFWRMIRCRKQNLEKAKHFAQCKFNAMHFFRRKEIRQHEVIRVVFKNHLFSWKKSIGRVPRSKPCWKYPPSKRPSNQIDHRQNICSNRLGGRTRGNKGAIFW